MSTLPSDVSRSCHATNTDSNEVSHIHLYSDPGSCSNDHSSTGKKRAENEVGILMVVALVVVLVLVFMRKQGQAAAATDETHSTRKS